MKRIKAIGLAVFTALALTAFTGVASAAPAGFSIGKLAEGVTVFHSEAYPATIKGTQIAGKIGGEVVPKINIKTAAGTIKCNKATFSTPSPYLQLEDTSDLYLTPASSECFLNGTQSVTEEPVEPCWDIFHVVNGSSPLVGSADLCWTRFTVAKSKCKIYLQPQTRTGMEYSNIGSGSSATVEARANLSGVEYEIREGAECPNAPANGIHSDGSYKGAISLSSTS